jgi:hypothetical protein
MKNPTAIQAPHEAIPHRPFVAKHALHLVVIIIIVFLGSHSLHLNPLIHIPFPVARRNFILAAFPQILESELLGTTKTLNISNAIYRFLEKLVEARLRANVVESTLHGNAVGTDPGVAVNGKDGEVVVLADEVGSRHDVAGLVEGKFG